jgi:hypothetical protein
MNAWGLIKYNFKDNQEIYDKFKSACGYLGYALALKFSMNVMYRFYRLFFRNRIKIEKYKKDCYTYPNQIHFVQQKNINHVVINLSYYNFQDLKNDEIVDLLKKYFERGFIIVFISNRVYKNKLKEIISNLEIKKQDMNKINFISFDPVWDGESFLNKMKEKLHAFNKSGNKISIFINLLSRGVEKISAENKPTNIFNQMILLKICIKEMLLNKGKSLILSIDLKDNSSPDFFNFDIFQLKSLLKMIRYEYYPKIDIITVPQFYNKYNSIKYYLKKILKN